MSYGEQTDAEWLEVMRAWAERNAETNSNARTVRRILQLWDADVAALRIEAERLRARILVAAQISDE